MSARRSLEWLRIFEGLGVFFDMKYTLSFSNLWKQKRGRPGNIHHVNDTRWLWGERRGKGRRRWAQ